MHKVDPATEKPYLQRITITEARTQDKYPVHVGDRFLLDGVEHPDLIDLTEGWSAYALKHETLSGKPAMIPGPTVVTFSVPADRVVLPQYDEDGHYAGGCLLDGVPVLSPQEPAWEMYQPRGKPMMVRVYAYVATFEFTTTAPAEVPA